MCPTRSISFTGLVVLLWTGACVSAQRTAPGPFDYRQTDSLAVSILQRVDRSDYMIAELEYDSPVEGRVPAWLWEPEHPVGTPAPAVILMHGMPGTRASLGGLARAYAAAGLYVLAISAPWNRPLPYRTPRLIPFPLYSHHDSAEVVQLIQDLRRGVDFLQSRPEVDDNRIGFVGFSAGGMAGAILAGVEHRISAYVLMVPTPGWASTIRYNARERPGALGLGTYLEMSADEQQAWLASMEPLEATGWIGGARSTEILIQGSLTDRRVPALDVALLFAAAPRPKSIRWYDLPHELGPAAFADQALFLAEILEFDPDRFVVPEGL